MDRVDPYPGCLVSAFQGYHIVGRIGHGGDTQGRGDVNDQAAGTLTHRPDAVLTAKEHTAQIDRDAAMPHGQLHVLDRHPAAADAGAVQQRDLSIQTSYRFSPVSLSDARR